MNDSPRQPAGSRDAGSPSNPADLPDTAGSSNAAGLRDSAGSPHAPGLPGPASSLDAARLRDPGSSHNPGSLGGSSDSGDRSNHDRRQRRLLVGIALLFFTPLAVSFYLYYGPMGWRPTGHVNRGDLIDPARPLPEVSLPVSRHAAGGQGRAAVLKGKWTLLYVGSGSCSALCRTDLYNTRQVRTALNRDMDRVQRVFIAEDACCDWPFLDTQHPDLLTIQPTAATAQILGVLPTVDGVAPLDANRVYLIDPLGNLMMSYAPTANPKGLLQDLKRLLGLSSVG
jgi:cytochrome oxidase Cu insertion factor (SCO1/SenC/PrrC family)